MFQPISEWSALNVVEWMAAVNLYPYADLFIAKDIKGEDLLRLNKDKLTQIGIRDEFHQIQILLCIEQLTSLEIDETLDPHKDGGPPHEFKEHSWSSLKRCERCNKYLRGLFHQGMKCQSK